MNKPPPPSFHEDFDRTSAVTAGSERAFGFVFFMVFVIIATWPLFSGGTLRLWSLGIAAAFLATAVIRPCWLSPLNRLWFLFGLLLHRIVTPVLMALLFFLVFTPTGLAMRLLRKDHLRRRLDPNAESYWVERVSPGPSADSMRNQF